MPWLTGDETPTEFLCRRLFIPNELPLVMAVNGALLDLIYERNWEKFGDATPEQVASLMQTMFMDFLADDGCDEGGTMQRTDVAILEFRLSDGSSGLTAPDDDWLVIPLNTIVSDAGGHVSNGGSGPYIALTTGEYEIEATVAASNTDRTRMRLKNNNTGATMVAGLSSGPAESGFVVAVTMTGIFTADIAHNYALQLWCDSGGSNKVGRPDNSSIAYECYAQIKLTKRYSVES